MVIIICLQLRKQSKKQNKRDYRLQKKHKIIDNYDHNNDSNKQNDDKYSTEENLNDTFSEYTKYYICDSEEEYYYLSLQRAYYPDGYYDYIDEPNLRIW